MSKHTFSIEEQKLLSNNYCIKKVSNKSIIFTDQFKIDLIRNCSSVNSIDEFLNEFKLSTLLLGQKRMQENYYRWKAIYSKEGPAGLVGKQKGTAINFDTKSFNNLSDSEKALFYEKENKKLKTELEIIKKLSALSINRNSKPKVLYKLIQEIMFNNKEFSASLCCNILKVNINNYYKFNKNSKIDKAQSERKLLSDIIFLQKKYNYKLGYRRIKMLLDEAYISYGLKPVNHKRILRICRKHNINCTVRTRNKYKNIAKATKEHNYFDNKLDRKFNIGNPMTKILTDITYLHYNNGTAYLSCAKDSVTGEIIAYNLRSDMKINLSLDILEKLGENKTGVECLIHPDQGVHYTSPVYSKKLKSLGYTQSMSRRGNCLDNAPMESFFGHLKDEVDYKEKKTIPELRRVIDEYMLYYNKQRKQWNKNKMSPIQYRQHLMQSI